MEFRNMEIELSISIIEKNMHAMYNLHKYDL